MFTAAVVGARVRLFVPEAVKVFISLGLLLGIAAPAGAQTQWPNPFGLLPTEEDYELKLLGKFVFFDEISMDGPDGTGHPADMSCSSCHTPDTGGTNGDSDENLIEVGIRGANPGTRGTLKPPTNSYATFIRPFQVDPSGPPQPGACPAGLPARACGGNFWDGRAEGDQEEFNRPGETKPIGLDVIPLELQTRYAQYLGPVADQAINPFPNDVEQNVPDGPNDNGFAGATFVCMHVAMQNYAVLYKLAWDEPINCDPGYADISFKRIAVAIAAYQASDDVNSFTSRRDYALRAELMCVERHRFRSRAVCRHKDYVDSPGEFPLVGLTAQENFGHDLFYNDCRIVPAQGPPSKCEEGNPNIPFPDLPLTQCSGCHNSEGIEFTPGVTSPGSLGTALLERYTDDSYHTIGTPFNREVPGVTADNPQRFLGAHTGFPGHDAMMKTPTLRNVNKRPHPDFVKAYAANGWFKSMESIVHYYNTANVKDSCESKGFVSATEAEALANDCWPQPAIDRSPIFPPAQPRPPSRLGDLGLTPEHEAALVAYLGALSDIATARKPRNIEILLAKIVNRLRD